MNFTTDMIITNTTDTTDTTDISSINNNYSGKIELIIGPMFSGKSTELLRRLNRYEIAGKKCLKIKHSSDTRYSFDSITTHNF